MNKLADVVEGSLRKSNNIILHYTDAERKWMQSLSVGYCIGDNPPHSNPHDLWLLRIIGQDN